MLQQKLRISLELLVFNIYKIAFRKKFNLINLLEKAQCFLITQLKNFKTTYYFNS